MQYALSTSYIGESLLSGFNWFNGADLSNGYVSYQSRSDAEEQGLVSMNYDTHAVRLGVDSTNVYSMGEGRPSVRIESKESYNHGLFIADFEHMPPSDCGLWPAFWAYGRNWPNGGEIDIIEGVNTAHKNLMSAHTAQGCSQDPWEVSQSTGVERHADCFVGDQNIGCGFEPPSSDVSSYGDAFNAVNGGVYAMDWNSEHIRIWHFPRGQIPSDITAKKPNPSVWGRPQASFGGRSCDVDRYFKDMSIVLNINFCGDYGNALWNSGQCNSYASTCSEYVGNNPDAFTHAYWEVNYIDVYEKRALPPTPPPTVPTPPPTSPIRPPPPFFPFPFPDPGIGFEPASIPNPTRINRYAYLGCFESTSDFGTFEVTAEEEDMTLQTCVSLCDAKGAEYAGVNGKVCSCAPELDQDTRAVSHQSRCSKPCPGNSGEFCGGSNSKDTRDEETPSCLLTVYGAVLDSQPPVPPPMAPMPKSLMKGAYVVVNSPTSDKPTPAALAANLPAAKTPSRHTPTTPRTPSGSPTPVRPKKAAPQTPTTSGSPSTPRTPTTPRTPSTPRTPTTPRTPSSSPTSAQRKKEVTTLQLAQASDTKTPVSTPTPSRIPISTGAAKAPSRMSVVIGVAFMVIAMM